MDFYEMTQIAPRSMEEVSYIFIFIFKVIPQILWSHEVKFNDLVLIWDFPE